ncbi:MAG: zinc ribbon domain-containing protein [Aquificota bacterium]|nr:MAG: zinc ribbon domain-containing protein [Aquificota bacterium]
MPLYEFQCKACGHRFVQLVLPLSQHEEVKCPKCGNKELKRLFSSFSSSGTKPPGGCAPSG